MDISLVTDLGRPWPDILELARRADASGAYGIDLPPAGVLLDHLDHPVADTVDRLREVAVPARGGHS